MTSSRDLEFPDRTPNPFWVRSEEKRDGLAVLVRKPSDPNGEIPASSEAFWWGQNHEKWYCLSVVREEFDFDAVLTALLSPAQK